MTFYPLCPECGAEADHEPIQVFGGKACFKVHHDHGPCPVSKYIACIDWQGRQSNIPLRDGAFFEDVMGDAA